MNVTENFKDISLCGRNWRIKKFDARTGSYMLIKVMGIIAPVLKGFDVKSLKDVKSPSDIGVNFTELASGLTSLSEQDFRYVQDKCLKMCYEMLPAGPAPVIDDTGNYGVQNIENDVSLVMGLTVHCLVFNVSGFFGGSLSTLFKGAIPDLSQQDSPT